MRSIDAYGVLEEGKSEDVKNAVKAAIAHGVDGIWSGCGLWPTVPKERMVALLDATRKYGAR